MEQEAAKELEKEELMKQLTVAYQNKDLHTILKFELASMQNDENDLYKIADGKLFIYNLVL